MMRAPNAKLDRLVDAAIEPLTLVYAKNYLRVDFDEDDQLISDMITAARIECETLNDRSFIATQWQMRMDYFPPYAGRLTNVLPALAFGVAALGGRSLWVNMEGGAIRLPMAPLISVDSIAYIDPFGVHQQLSVVPSDNKVIISPGTPGQIAPAFGQIFPLTMPILSAVTIQFTAGYGTDATTIPKTVMAAMRLLVAHYYEHRTSDVPVPATVERLLGATAWGGY